MYLVSYQSKVFHHFGEQVCFSNWSLLPVLGVPLCAITKGNTLHLPIDLPLQFVAEWRSNYGRTCTDLNKVVKLGLNYVHVSTSIGHTGNNGWCLIPDISHGYLFVCLEKVTISYMQLFLVAVVRSTQHEYCFLNTQRSAEFCWWSKAFTFQMTRSPCQKL